MLATVKTGSDIHTQNVRQSQSQNEKYLDENYFLASPLRQLCLILRRLAVCDSFVPMFEVASVTVTWRKIVCDHEAE